MLAALQLEIIAEPSEMGPGIGEDDPAFGQQSADDLGKTRGMNRARQRCYDPAFIVAAIDDCRRARAGLGIKRFSHRADRKLRIGDQRIVGLMDLVDFALRNVDVDQRAAVEQAFPIVECRVLVERVADGHDDICVHEGLPCAGMATVAEYAD